MERLLTLQKPLALDMKATDKGSQLVMSTTMEDADVYVTNYRADVFYQNNGDGTFTLQEVGLSNEAWGTSATFGDYDRDGYLDLYVANYVQFDPEAVCRGKHGAPDYCNPQVFEPAADRVVPKQR